MDGNILSISDSEYTFSNLQSGTEHTFRVRALGDDSTSEWSELVKVNTLIGDLTINENMTLSEDIICSNLYVNSGTLNLNGYKLIVLGNVIQKDSTMYVNGGSLIVNGDYSISGDSYLDMDYAQDYVLVNGNFMMESKKDLSNYLSNGILEVKGNITQKSVDGYSDSKFNFKQTENFVLKISGDNVSQIRVTNPYQSSFNIIDSRSCGGVKFCTKIRLTTFKNLENVDGGVNLYYSHINLDDYYDLN